MCVVTEDCFKLAENEAKRYGLTVVKAPVGIVVFNDCELFVIRTEADGSIKDLFHQNYMKPQAGKKFSPKKLPSWEKIDRKVLFDNFHKQDTNKTRSIHETMEYIKCHGLKYKHIRTKANKRRNDLLDAIARGDKTFFPKGMTC